MRFSKAWIVASKEFKTLTKRKNILYSSLYFESIVSIGLPFLIRYVSGKMTDPTTALPVLLSAFSFLFVIGASLLPVTMASYSLVGEKVQKSLEPLLATPTTDEEILAGKSIAAFLPAFAINLVGALIFTTLVDHFTHNILDSYFFPNWDIIIIVLLLGPLACLLAVGYNVLISSRMNDVRAAQQFGALILLPFAAIYVLSETRVLELTTNALLIMAAILIGIDAVMFFLAKATFQREEILTKWK